MPLPRHADHFVRHQWGFPCSLGMGAPTHVAKFSGILEYITPLDRNRTAFYTISIITEFGQNGIYGPKSYWVRITSGMFPRPVPTSQMQSFVRYHFLGLISSWGPVALVFRVIALLSYLLYNILTSHPVMLYRGHPFTLKSQGVSIRPKRWSKKSHINWAESSQFRGVSVGNLK